GFWRPLTEELWRPLKEELRAEIVGQLTEHHSPFPSLHEFQFFLIFQIRTELVNQGLGCIYEVINVVVLLEMAVHRQIEIHDTIFKPDKQDLGFD
ncbi:unnamed protein product, partial [Cuscuta campestris]